MTPSVADAWIASQCQLNALHVIGQQKPLWINTNHEGNTDKCRDESVVKAVRVVLR